MKRKSLAGTVFVTILVIALAVTLAVTYFVLRDNVVLKGKVYPRHQEVLDLRDDKLSIRDYEKLARQMPDTQIMWSVPVQDTYVPDDTEKLTVSGVEGLDAETLGCLPKLKTIDATACSDYPGLLELYRANPDIRVEYNVEIGGEEYPADAETITLHSLTDADAECLAYLPELKTIDAMECPDFAAVTQLAEAHSEWNVEYLTSIAGAAINPNATSLEMTGATYEELAYALLIMPELKSIMVHNPAAEGSQLQTLREDYPDVKFRWDVEVEGSVFADDIKELDLSYFRIPDVGTAQEIASRFPVLEKLIVDSTGIDNEEMAAFREEMRSSYKVVWTVELGDICKARTDETWFMPIRQGDYYFNEQAAYNLRYCEDMVCIDVGHSIIRTIDWVTYMPHLKYLILAWTQVFYIDPISSCKELIYLEIDHTPIRELEPLTGCTALEDINLNELMNYPDVSPVCEMTWLKNVWAADMGASKKQMLVDALPDSNVVTADYSTATGMGWRNLQNYYDMRDYLGMYYMN